MAPRFGNVRTVNSSSLKRTKKRPVFGVGADGLRRVGGMGRCRFVQLLWSEFSWRGSLHFGAISARPGGVKASIRILLARVGDCHMSGLPVIPNLHRPDVGPLQFRARKIGGKSVLGVHGLSVTSQTAAGRTENS